MKKNKKRRIRKWGEKVLLLLAVCLMFISILPTEIHAAYRVITSQKKVHYAVTIQRETDGIHKNGPHNTEGAVQVAFSKEYMNQNLQVTKEMVTDNKVTWVLLSKLDGTEIGWMDKAGVKQGNDYRVITSQKNVNYAATVVTEKDGLYKNGPHNTPTAVFVSLTEAVQNKKFQVTKEMVTDNVVTWCFLKDLSGNDVGWLDKRALKLGNDFRNITSQKEVNYIATVITESDGMYANGPHNTPGAVSLGLTEEEMGTTFHIKREVITDNKVTWVLMYYFDGERYKEFGWVDKKAVKENAKNKATDRIVSYDAVITEKDENNIYSNEVNSKNLRGIKYSSDKYTSKTAHVSKERILSTSDGNYKLAYLNVDGKELGWIDSESLTEKLTEDSKVEQIEDTLLKHLDLNDNSLQINSEEFAAFALNQMLEDADEELAARSDYEIITDYLSEYFNALTESISPPEMIDIEGEQEVFSPIIDEDLNIEDIIDEDFSDEDITDDEENAEEKEKEVNSENIDENYLVGIPEKNIIDVTDIQPDPNISPLEEEKESTIEELNDIAQYEEVENNGLVDESGLLKASGYNRSKAIAYAKKWYNKRNPNYRNYSDSSGDCTNFVSQCIYNGGKKEVKITPVPYGTKKTTKHWFSQIVYTKVWSQRSYVYYKTINNSTSWVNVSDFSSFWSKTQPVKTFTNVNSAISYARPGDIVQFKKKGGSRYFHSMIAVEKSNKTLYMAGHTNSYKRRNIKSAMKNMKGASIRIIRF
ncbi:GW dipeptide domain-containing protein [Listeria welshimeri]|uniref:GW dipeptide domain-containing protein n=1 Tax=Listeria welshimeri TaxID=1643 RepID=UPI0018895B9E|nr:GW dipeptide domain-containing protein [Listeria welshimeri]MBF2445947.1 SH3-like domain-containing protein [Listeria welshimeri]